MFKCDGMKQAHGVLCVSRAEQFRSWWTKNRMMLDLLETRRLSRCCVTVLSFHPPVVAT